MPDNPYAWAPEMSKEQLVEAAFDITGGSLRDLSREDLVRKLTTASHVFDLCLNELERRGLFETHHGMPIVPYCSEHSVETVLTRGHQG